MAYAEPQQEKGVNEVERGVCSVGNASASVMGCKGEVCSVGNV